jgi:hypothetical protein
MIRAFALSASLASFALVLGVCGCHEEPTIVIKFEPNDAAMKPADMARPADMTRIADMTPAKVASKEAKHECKRATDCALEALDCCDCANGGKQHAVPKKQLAKLKAERAKRCKDAMCTMMLSTDPTCGQQADCVQGACVMAPKAK